MTGEMGEKYFKEKTENHKTLFKTTWTFFLIPSQIYEEKKKYIFFLNQKVYSQ